MTINCTASSCCACTSRWPRSRASRGRSWAGPSRTTCSRSSSPRRSGSARPSPAVRIVVDMIEFCMQRHAALAPGVDQRATTSGRPGRRQCRSWRSRWPTASRYVEECVKRGLDRRRFAPAALLLLRRPQRLLRGDRQVAGGPAHLGDGDEGALRRPEPAGDAAAHARPDRRRVADRPAAATTTSSASRSRRWRRCWAAPSRCTPTRSTRPTRLPTEEAVTIALRTQQVIADESGVRTPSTRSAAATSWSRSPTGWRPRPGSTSAGSTRWAG